MLSTLLVATTNPKDKFYRALFADERAIAGNVEAAVFRQNRHVWRPGRPRCAGGVHRGQCRHRCPGRAHSQNRRQAGAGAFPAGKRYRYEGISLAEMCRFA